VKIEAAFGGSARMWLGMQAARSLRAQQKVDVKTIAPMRASWEDGRGRQEIGRLSGENFLCGRFLRFYLPAAVLLRCGDLVAMYPLASFRSNWGKRTRARSRSAIDLVDHDNVNPAVLRHYRQGAATGQAVRRKSRRHQMASARWAAGKFPRLDSSLDSV
jgi:hypothetical protein